MKQRLPLVLATSALAVALFGSTPLGSAAQQLLLPAKSVGTKQLRNGAVTSRTLHDKAVTGSKVAPNSLTGAQINESTLGIVPNATHAANADHATSASSATNADHATNADNLGGSPASSYIPGCPGDLHRAPHTDLCFDLGERPAASWTDALKTCALAGLRLPDAGELAQAFNDLGAFQAFEWTTSLYFSPSGVAGMIAQDASRTIMVNADLVTHQHPFRCVTTAHN